MLLHRKASGVFRTLWCAICVRYLLQNMDWLEEELGGYDDDYLIFDCPGTSWPFHLELLFQNSNVPVQDKLNCIHIIPFCRLSCRTSQGWESVHVLYIYWNRSSWKIDTSSSGADQIVSLSVAIFSKLIPALLS